MCKLEDRRFLRVIGKDSKSVLQGIVTNNLNTFYEDSNIACQYNLFLNAQGRIINDAFIYRPYTDFENQEIPLLNEIWIDIHKDFSGFLQRYIKRFCLRKHISIEDISDQIQAIQIIQETYLNDKELQGKIFNRKIESKNISKFIDVLDQSNIEEVQYSKLMFIDPRSRSMQMRIICTKDELPNLNADQVDVKIGTSEDYDIYRILNGIAEGNEISGKLPLPVNMDYLNAISFKKGCYVGQELTSRSFHTGIVRKRLFPFILTKNDIFKDYFQQVSCLSFDLVDKDFSLNLMGQTLVNKNQEKIGKVLYQKHNIGLVQCEYQNREQGNFQINFQDYYGQILVNDCFQEYLDEYQQEMDRKQQSVSRIFNEEI